MERAVPLTGNRARSRSRIKVHGKSGVGEVAKLETAEMTGAGGHGDAVAIAQCSGKLPHLTAAEWKRGVQETPDTLDRAMAIARKNLARNAKA
jgi:hypothetical protein